LSSHGGRRQPYAAKSRRRPLVVGHSWDEIWHATAGRAWLSAAAREGFPVSAAALGYRSRQSLTDSRRAVARSCGHCRASRAWGSGHEEAPPAATSAPIVRSCRLQPLRQQATVTKA